MKRSRIFISIFILIAMAASLISVPAYASPSSPAVYTVKQDGTGDFTTIQAAADVVQAGDTILVYSGVYREQVIIPRGGTGEDARVTLKVAPGEDVTVTGSDIVTGWDPVAGQSDVYSITLPETFFTTDLNGEYFNPYNVRWQSAVGGNYPTCGTIYLNDVRFNEAYTAANVYSTANTFMGTVDTATGITTVIANFGGVDPNAAGNVTETNVRKQCITAAWNQGYITIDGFNILRGCAPKTIDFWKSYRLPMSGGVATNGGYYWIIENCDVTQCRGVAVDFGFGSRMQEVAMGGTPEIYGFHKIRYNKVYENCSNGIMAYCGPYTEIYGNVIANNNAMNTRLASEAYVKDVNGGWGISIHDNYFYSDQSWGTLPVWLDSECDGCIVSNNIIYSVTGGFTGIEYETDHGWNLCSNNILVGANVRLMGQVSDTYYVNNLFINSGTISTINATRMGNANSIRNESPVPAFSSKEDIDTAAEAAIAAGAREIQGLGVEGIGWIGRYTNQNPYYDPADPNITHSGSEGATTIPNGASLPRTMRPIVPGTLKILGSTVPDYRGYDAVDTRLPLQNRYNKLLNNILIGNTTVSGSGTEVSPSDFVPDWIELTRNYEAIYENGGRQSTFYPATPRAVELLSYDNYAKYVASTAYGNRADYNAYYGGARSSLSNFITGDGYIQDGNSVSNTDSGDFQINATMDSFSITLTVDESVLDLGRQSYLTKEVLGPADAYRYLGVDWYPDDNFITKDIYGNNRDEANNVIGPFADLRPGVNTYDLWPNIMNKAYVTITGSPTVVTGSGATASYTISAEFMPLVSGIELEFEVDGNYLSSKDFTALGGFSFFGDGNYGTPVVWKNAGNIWTGKVTLINIDFNTIDSETDLFNMVFNVPEGALGDTTVKLNYVKMSYGGNVVYALVKNDSFTTVFEQYYSPYDLNKDGVIDLNDLTYALQYLLVDSTMPEWEQAKVCNFDDTDDVITINDLILILANYTIPYYS